MKVHPIDAISKWNLSVPKDFNKNSSQRYIQNYIPSALRSKKEVDDLTFKTFRKSSEYEQHAK